MPFSKITTPTALAGTLVSIKATSASAYNNVTGNNSGLIYQIQIDNSNNTDSPVYVKYADSASTTPGSTVADMILYVTGGKKVTHIIEDGMAYSSGVSIWCTRSSNTGDISDSQGLVTITLLST